jgi:hypothetical protein
LYENLVIAHQPGVLGSRPRLVAKEALAALYSVLSATKEVGSQAAKPNEIRLVSVV